MKQTRKHFSQDYLLAVTRDSVKATLTELKCKPDKINRVVDSFMSALAMFSFKYPDLEDFVMIQTYYQSHN